jgi:hypothetical protein
MADDVKDANKLMADALQQLAEHKAWLKDEIDKIPSEINMAAAKSMLRSQVDMIKLRLARVDQNRASVVYDYPDELFAFLQAPSTPQLLRDTLVGGHLVSTEQPAHTFRRES